MKTLITFIAPGLDKRNPGFINNFVSTRICRLIILLVLMLMMPWACADSGSEKIDKTYQLQGTWVHCPGCLVLDQYSEKVTMEFSTKDKTFTQIISLNNRDDISIGLNDFKISGTYETGDKVEIATLYGSIYPMQIDFTLDTATVTPTSDWGVAYMNDANNLFMGINGWVVNEERDVTSINASLARGTITYDIFWIDDESDILFFGDANSGDKTSAATRPVNLASDPFLKIETK